jgi:hypothetical protein
MARIRTVKPSFFKSLTVTALPKPTRLTWIGLWTYADDAGRGVDDARLIKAELWPLDDDYTAKKVEKDMQLLEANGSIRRYVVDGRRYFAVVEWKHQRIDKPTPSTLPTPPPTCTAPLPPDSGNPPGGRREASVQEEEGKGLGREGNGDLPSSSSKLNLVGRPAADDDEGSPTQKALALMADRRIAAAIAAGNVILNPGGYRRRTLEGLNGELGDKAETMLKAGATPEAVADKLVPAGSAAASRWPTFEPPPDPDEPLASVNGLAGVRSALGGGA